MKYLLPLLIILGSCNYAAETTPDGTKKAAVSVGVNPQQVSTGTKANAGPPETNQAGPSTTKTPVSDAEIQAQTSRYIFASGIGIVLLGVGLMVARHYTAGIAVPSWLPRKVIMVGACVAVWGSVPASYRGWIVAIVVVAGLFWMYYGSKSHNLKLIKEKSDGTTETS